MGGPCGTDPFFHDPFATSPMLRIGGIVDAYAIAESKNQCGPSDFPDQRQLWSQSRRFDVSALGIAQSACSAFLNSILVETLSGSDSSECGGSADADVTLAANYLAGKLAKVFLAHGVFHVPKLQGGFMGDCCDTSSPCAYAFTGSRTAEPITSTIDFFVHKRARVIIDARLTILGCEEDTFDEFEASFSLTGIGALTLEPCSTPFLHSMVLQPGIYTLGVSLSYTITTGLYRDCSGEYGEGSAKPLISLEASVRSTPIAQPGPLRRQISVRSPAPSAPRVADPRPASRRPASPRPPRAAPHRRAGCRSATPDRRAP